MKDGLTSLISCYFTDAQWATSIGKVNPYSTGRHLWESQDTLIANGGGFFIQCQRLPVAFMQVFHVKTLHTLSQWDVFLQ